MGIHAALPAIAPRVDPGMFAGHALDAAMPVWAMTPQTAVPQSLNTATPLPPIGARIHHDGDAAVVGGAMAGYAGAGYTPMVPAMHGAPQMHAAAMGYAPQVQPGYPSEIDKAKSLMPPIWKAQYMMELDEQVRIKREMKERERQAHAAIDQRTIKWPMDGGEWHIPAHHTVRCFHRGSGHTFLRGLTSVDSLPQWQRDDLARKQRMQLETQDALRRQIAEKEADKARKEQQRKLDDEREQQRLIKEQEMLKERYAREQEEARRREEEARIENERQKADKMRREAERAAGDAEAAHNRALLEQLSAIQRVSTAQHLDSLP
nr:hypothetical protein HK105_008073 [Polyrhizophydium stewartii]